MQRMFGVPDKGMAASGWFRFLSAFSDAVIRIPVSVGLSLPFDSH